MSYRTVCRITAADLQGTDVKRFWRNMVNCFGMSSEQPCEDLLMLCYWQLFNASSEVEGTDYFGF